MTRLQLWLSLIFFLIGAGAGLAYAWLFAPIRATDFTPAALRADFKDQYRLVIAAAYAANGNLERARARLSLLNDPDPYAVLSTQAQRALANGDRAGAYHLAQLATALRQEVTAESPLPTEQVAASSGTPLLETPLPPVIFSSDQIPVPEYTPTPRPARTATSPPAPPFQVLSQQTLCDETLPEGLLQIIVQTANRNPLLGVEVILSWAGGEEHIFTGLKPELGSGYADTLLRPEVTYTLRVVNSGVLLTDLITPTCKKLSGETYWGSIKIILQRP